MRKNLPLPRTNPEFRAWRYRMDWDQPEAAKALHLSFEHVGRFDRGERPATPIVRLAMEALEMRRFVKPGDLTPEGHAITVTEGWGLFIDDANRLVIQRDDARRRFRTDAAAIAFVRVQAIAGSALHQTALAIHNENRIRMVA